MWRDLIIHTAIAATVSQDTRFLMNVQQQVLNNVELELREELPLSSLLQWAPQWKRLWEPLETASL